MNTSSSPRDHIAELLNRRPELTCGEGMEHFLTCHRNALEYFCATPLAIIIDNLKTGVLQHRFGEKAIFNPRYLDFASRHFHSLLLFRYVAGLSFAQGAIPVLNLTPALHLPLQQLSVKWKSPWGIVELAWDKTPENQSKVDLRFVVPPGCLASLTVRSRGGV